jgi:hypothetical protein
MWHGIWIRRTSIDSMNPGQNRVTLINNIWCFSWFLHNCLNHFSAFRNYHKMKNKNITLSENIPLRPTLSIDTLLQKYFTSRKTWFSTKSDRSMKLTNTNIKRELIWTVLEQKYDSISVITMLEMHPFESYLLVEWRLQKNNGKAYLNLAINNISHTNTGIVMATPGYFTCSICWRKDYSYSWWFLNRYIILLFTRDTRL